MRASWPCCSQMRRAWRSKPCLLPPFVWPYHRFLAPQPLATSTPPCGCGRRPFCAQVSRLPCRPSWRSLPRQPVCRTVHQSPPGPVTNALRGLWSSSEWEPRRLFHGTARALRVLPMSWVSQRLTWWLPVPEQQVPPGQQVPRVLPAQRPALLEPGWPAQQRSREPERAETPAPPPFDGQQELQRPCWRQPTKPPVPVCRVRTASPAGHQSQTRYSPRRKPG